MDAEAIPMARKHAAAFIPAVLDFSVTDYCQADCDFCGFARSKMRGKPRRFADAAASRCCTRRSSPWWRRRGAPGCGPV